MRDFEDLRVSDSVEIQIKRKGSLLKLFQELHDDPRQSGPQTGAEAQFRFNRLLVP